MRGMSLRRAGWPVLTCAWLAGCATPLEVRPLATGRVDVSAYELIGADPGALRREAQRLCPQGGEIVRQATQHQSPEKIDGRLRAWMNDAALWIDPPQRSAQMTVVCREVAGQNQIQAAAAAANASLKAPAPSLTPAPTTEVTAGVPVGPLNIEW